MKYTTIITLSALLLGSAGGFAQDDPPTAFSKPSGFVTHTISPGFNMIGLRLQKPILVSGILGAPSGESLPTNITDLTTALGTPDANSLVIVEIIEGDNAGMVIESAAWTGGSFTGISGLVASFEGDSFQVREAPSIADLFGDDNSAGFLEGSLQDADIIWVSRGGGAWSKYYYSPGDLDAFPDPISEGWKNSLDADAANTRFNYIDGIFVQRRGAGNISLVITGSVKTTKINLDVEGGNAFNFYSGIFPVSTTLGDSKLDDVLQHGDLSAADIIWMPNGPGAWKKYIYRDDDLNAFPDPVTEGWKDALDQDATDVEITSGFIIQRRGASVNVPFTPNELYDSL